MRLVELPNGCPENTGDFAIDPVTKAALTHRSEFDSFVQEFAKIEDDFVDPDTGIVMDQCLQAVYSQETGRLFVVRHSSEHQASKGAANYYVAELALGQRTPTVMRRTITDVYRSITTVAPELVVELEPAADVLSETLQLMKWSNRRGMSGDSGNVVSQFRVEAPASTAGWLLKESLSSSFSDRLQPIAKLLAQCAQYELEVEAVHEQQPVTLVA